MTFHEVISLFTRYIQRVNDIDVVQMCGLAEGTNATTLKTTRDIVYQLYNVQYTKVATDNIAMTACAAQAAGTFCFYLVSVNSAGTVLVTKGTDNAYSLPATPQGYWAIGAFKIVTVAVTFTSGTDDLSAAGITATFYDIDTGMASTFINQAMRKLERGVTVNLNGQPCRVSNWDHMKAKTTVPLVDGNYDIANPFFRYKELINAHIIDSNSNHWPELTRSDYDTAMSLFPFLASSKGRPLLITRAPTTETSLIPDIAPTFQFRLRPTCDTSYTIEMQAYTYSPDLDGVVYATNWLTENTPELLVYGALVEASPYLKEDERIETWQGLYTEQVAALASSQKLERWSGSKLQINSFNPFSTTISNIYEYRSW